MKIFMSPKGAIEYPIVDWLLGSIRGPDTMGPKANLVWLFRLGFLTIFQVDFKVKEGVIWVKEFSDHPIQRCKSLL